MPRYDFRSPRIHVEAPLGPGARIALNGDQANYLRNVLRLKAGDPVLRLQRPRGRMAGGAGGHRQTGRCARRDRANPGADRSA